MKKLANLIPSIMIALMLLIMAGCSGGGEDDVVSANSETSGNPGVGITATSYDKASTITLMKDSGTETGYVIIDNGAELSLNEKVRLGVKVEDGAYPVEKVLVGDGGGYQLTAKFNKDLGLYLCDYKITTVTDSDGLVPVLIQVAHPNGQASKAKYVFTTKAGAAANQLVRNGLGVLVGKDILKVNSPDGMNLSGMTISDLAPKANSKTAVLNATISGLGIPLGIIDTLTGEETEKDEVSPTLKLDPRLIGIKIIDDFISNVLLKKTLDMGPMALGLQDMLGPMTKDFGADISGLELAGETKPGKFLYLDINGVPSQTTADAAALSLGLFISKGEEEIFPSGVTLFPGSGDISHTELKDRGNASSIVISLSDLNMTQFLSEMLNGSVVVSALPIDLAVPNYKDKTKGTINQQMKISFNKSGIACDFSTENPLLIINDLRIEYLENGKPMWMMSLDLAFKLAVGSHQAKIEHDEKKDAESLLDIYLTLVPEFAHCAVLKDNMGITRFDHSQFVLELLGGLKDMLPSDRKDCDIQLSIPTGVLLKDGTIAEGEGFALMLSDATAVSDAGRCFLTMATEKTDLSKAGLCFINTAN